MKPTYGRVSRFGVVAFASSLDQVGPFGKTVEDCAIVCQALFGKDPNDATTMPRADEDLRRDLGKGVKGLRLGVPKEFFIDGMEKGVERAVRDALQEYARQGAEIVDISLPHTDAGLAVYYIIQPAEASSNLARYDGVRYGPRFNGAPDVRALYQSTRGKGFGPEVRRRILVGTYVLSAGYYDAYYRRAQRMRALIAQDFRNVFDRGVDLLFTPSTPTPAFKAGEKMDDPVAMYLADIFTVTANLAGIPGITLPIGRVDGLPVGGQLLAPLFLEDEMLEAAFTLERAVPGTDDV
jgi:aspartyl-tRNA(Asn)/glutamyl-tRNA(Gln) amidotransferase subunit A